MLWQKQHLSMLVNQLSRYSLILVVSHFFLPVAASFYSFLRLSITSMRVPVSVFDSLSVTTRSHFSLKSLPSSEVYNKNIRTYWNSSLTSVRKRRALNTPKSISFLRSYSSSSCFPSIFLVISTKLESGSRIKSFD